MFNFLNKKPARTGEQITIKLSGMHCTSCALNIDGVLEETPGIYKSNTSYAKSETKVIYEPDKITPKDIKLIIKKTGYDPV